MPLDCTDMERLRADLIQRSRMERGGSPNEGVVNVSADIDVEAGQLQPTMSQSRPVIAPLSGLLSRREPASMTGQPQLAEIESVKSQDSNSNRPNAGRRFAVPNFLRIWGRNNDSSQSDNVRNTTASPAPLLPFAEPLSPTRPEPVATPSQSQQSRRQRRRQNATVDPLEAHLSEILGGNIERQRRRRQYHEGDRDRHGSRRSREHRHPKYFLGCIPWVRSRRMRAQILRCMTSGLFLIILVTVCKPWP